MNISPESTDKRFTKQIIETAPEQASAWFAFDNSVLHHETVIPKKFKELIAIAVALTTQCPYCIEKHIKDGIKEGITQAEISQVTFIAAAVRAGASLGYGLLATKIFEEQANVKVV